MEIREKIVSDYFNAWITKDGSNLESIFSPDIIYSECYGPEYNGISQILKWFSDWNKVANVLEWRIKQFIHQNQFTVAEWYFMYEHSGNIGEFDGVSLIEFNGNNKIVSLKEFKSKSEHTYPYS